MSFHDTQSRRQPTLIVTAPRKHNRNDNENHQEGWQAPPETDYNRWPISHERTGPPVPPAPQDLCPSSSSPRNSSESAHSRLRPSAPVIAQCFSPPRIQSHDNHSGRVVAECFTPPRVGAWEAPPQRDYNRWPISHARNFLPDLPAQSPGPLPVAAIAPIATHLAPNYGAAPRMPQSAGESSLNKGASDGRISSYGLSVPLSILLWY